MSESIAITGATGLLGSNLANKLVEEGNEVYALIKDEQSKSILSKNVTRVYGDITSKSDIESYKEKIKKSEDDINKNEADQTKKKAEIEAQKKVVEEKEPTLPHLK